MADEHQRHAEFAAHRAQEVEDLRLDGDVERGGRLVGDKQFRPAGQGHGDHHALVLAAGEFMRIGIEAAPCIRNADELHEALGLGPQGATGEPGMQRQRLADLASDGEHGIEGARRVLEDHGDAAAADVVETGGRRADQFLAGEQDAPRHARLGRQQAESGEPGDRLARAGLADEADGLARRDGKVDAAQGRHAGKAHLEIADGNEGLGRGIHGRHAGQPILPARKSMYSIG